MENKKSLLIIFTIIISAHLLLFANLAIEEKVLKEEAIATPTVSKINLKNVVIKKIEPIVEKVVEKPIEVIKPLAQTKSKNILKHEEKKIKKIVKKEEPKKVIEMPIEKIEVTEKTQETKSQVQEVTSSNSVLQEKTINPSELQALENDYLSKLRHLIEKNKIYPNAAKRLNQMGKVHVYFMITKDGQIKNAKIVKDSKFKRLDDAALEILSKINKFEPIPEKLNKNSWEITVPITYEITRS